MVSEHLPEKLVSLDQLRISRGLEKICKCDDRRFIIDTANRRVNCNSCGAVVDPYEAILEIANNREAYVRELERLYEQRKQIVNYKPHLVVIKDLERQYRGRQMLPNCPRCYEPFYLEELTAWTGKPYADSRIKKFKDSQTEN
jgi:hypothetical protein